ncbi:histidine phosphatase family protein [Alteromonas sp. KUL49]|uniref:histidine phosphatase family protein n=1 Tax=Alteromonas sp. KUL49 TaxID=2480798 RepID=UPI00102F2946|nr:histidine phosphatase family protein [Alteromonas sp. KUL49]TAP39241.1 phosphoglycerate mutase family protein [Alteromonas sp. KUL49]GEA12020.1 hypothetical protein KUL49_23950 [Alteromonas sp. KUL49]
MLKKTEFNIDREIILIRHGKPLSAKNDKLNAAGFARWVKDYGHSELDPANYPASKSNLFPSLVISSSFKRAKLSAEYYIGEKPELVLSELKEMDIPYYRLPFTLKAWHWVFLNRFLWILGIKGPFESFSQAKARVKGAASILHKASQSHERIVVFGHGMSNRYLRIYLKQLGWQVNEKSNSYWGISKLSLSLNE